MSKIDWSRPIEWSAADGEWLPARYVATYRLREETCHLILVTHRNPIEGEFLVHLTDGYLAGNARNTPPKMVTKYVAAWWDGSTLKIKCTFSGETILLDTSEELLNVFGGNTFAIPVQVPEIKQ